MTDGYWVNPEALQYRADTWRELGALMDSSRSDLQGASSGVFPPSVVGAAQDFLSTWAASAGESSTMAASYAESLEANRTGYAASDQAASEAFSRLDAHLGPGR